MPRSSFESLYRSSLQGLRRRSGARSSLAALAALGSGLKLQRSSAAKAPSCSDARQGKVSQVRPQPMSHSLQRRATASVEEPSKAAAQGVRVWRVLRVLRVLRLSVKAWLKRATQQFRLPILKQLAGYVTARAGFGSIPWPGQPRNSFESRNRSSLHGLRRRSRLSWRRAAALAEDSHGLGWGASKAAAEVLSF